MRLTLSPARKLYGLSSLQVIRQALVQREEQDSKIEQRWQAQLKEESVARSNLNTVLAVFVAKVSACIDIYIYMLDAYMTLN